MLFFITSCGSAVNKKRNINSYDKYVITAPVVRLHKSFSSISVGGLNIGMNIYQVMDKVGSGKWDTLEFSDRSTHARKINYYSYDEKESIDWLGRGDHTITVNFENNISDRSGQYQPSLLFIDICSDKVERIQLISNKKRKLKMGMSRSEVLKILTNKKIMPSDKIMKALKDELIHSSPFQAIKLIKLKNQPTRLLGRYNPIIAGNSYLFNYSLDYQLPEYGGFRKDETIRSSVECRK